MVEVDAYPLAQFRSRTRMVEVPMGQPDACQLEPEVIERAHEPLDIAAGVDERGMLRRFIPDQRAILLQRRHRHDADLEFVVGFAHCCAVHLWLAQGDIARARGFHHRSLLANRRIARWAAPSNVVTLAA